MGIAGTPDSGVSSDSAAQLAERASRLLIDASPAVHYLARVAERYPTTFVSDGVREQLGYDPARFIQEPDFWIDHIHPADRARVIAELSRILETGRQRQEYRFRHSDGSWRWMLDEAVLIRDDDGEPLEIAGAWLDITGHKEFEVSLARQKAFVENLIEAAPAIILLLDPNGRIREMNPYMEQITGYSAEEVIGKDWFSTFLPEHERHEIHDLFETVMEAGTNAGHTNPIVAKDGSLRHIEWQARMLKDENGTCLGLLNIGHDVTERIGHEAALDEARRKAERVNASKSRFLAAASHDLRQPLYALRLFLGTLVGQLDTSDQLEICRKMERSIDSMAELLDALLDISKLESGSVLPQKQNVSVQALLDSVVLANQQQARKKGLELECAATECIVHTDPVLLERVISNFVDNAIRHTDNGSVRIDCTSNGSARIAVSDTGVGIPKGELDRIFEEYFQLENPSRDRRKGLGLGLAIVKHIARLLDHRVDVASAPGEGSTFSIEVPLGAREAVETEPGRRSNNRVHDEGKARVLLVEDDVAVVDGTRMLLESWGTTVVSASNGTEALARINEGLVPNIVISDYRLPGESGIEVIRRIRELAGEDIPSVIVTGDVSLPKTEFDDLGNCSLLYKPIEIDRLAEIFEQLTPAS